MRVALGGESDGPPSPEYRCAPLLRTRRGGDNGLITKLPYFAFWRGGCQCLLEDFMNPNQRSEPF